MIRKVRSLAHSWLAATSIGTVFLQLLSRKWPFPQILAARNDAKKERTRLETWKNSSFDQELILRFDERYNFPGKGDLFLVLMLANFLSELGFKVEFSQNLGQVGNSSAREFEQKSEASTLITQFLSSSVGLCFEPELPIEKLNRVVLRRRVEKNRDVSGPALLLISLLYSSKVINPSGIKPAFPGPSVPGRSEIPIRPRLEVRRVGFHVRDSGSNTFRNPDLASVISDFTNLAENFPSAQIVWFGEEGQFLKFLNLASDLGLDQNRVVYQESKGFAEAAREVLTVDFWFQRFGGGIGAVAYFSELPYLFLSSDVGAVRQYDYKKRKVVSWARKSQRFILLNRRDTSSGKFLTRVLPD